MTKVLFILSTLISASAMANPTCLAQVSNNELLNEVSRRMSGGGGSSPIGGNGAILTVNCDSGGVLYLRTINPSTGAQKSVNSYIGAINCSAYVNSLSQVSNVGLSRNILVSHCDSGGVLYKTLVSVDGALTAVSNDYVGNNTCQRTAIDANSRLQP